MRIRTLVVAAILAVVVLLSASPAFAESPGKKHGRELVDCVEKALRDHRAQFAKKNYDPFETALEDCRKAKSLITPDVAELLWGSIAFAIVAFVLMKFGWPAIRQAIQAREEKIRADLEAAESMRTEADQELTTYRQQIADARQEGNRIIEEAREGGEAVRRERITQAEADAAEIRQRAQEDARLAVERAEAELRRRVAEFSVDMAEKIVERNLDRETQIALIENYINSVGNGSRT